jgi:hypothetical protein
MDHREETAHLLMEAADNLEEIAEKMMHTDGGGRHPEIQPWDYNGVYSAIMQLREAIEDMM